MNIPSNIAGKPVTVIGENAFEGCHLSRVTIPVGVTTIGDYAFDSCSTLTEVAIPSNVTNIGGFAFYGCNLISVSIPASVTSIGNSPFTDCTQLANINVDVGNLNYSSLNGVLFNKLETVILEYPAGRNGNYLIPASVTDVGAYAFDHCGGLNSVTFPSTVTSIGDVAFGYCAGLTSVTLPSAVNNLGNYAFFEAGLTRAKFLGNAPMMGTSVFDNTSVNFTVFYISSKSGFSFPIWQTYQSLGVPEGPEIDVQQPVRTQLKSGISKKSFGTVAFGKTGVTKTFTIGNSGNADLTGLTVFKDGPDAADFDISVLSKTSLVIDEVTTFKVSFKPTIAGTRNATIHITSNDANENPFEIKVTGMGVVP